MARPAVTHAAPRPCRSSPPPTALARRQVSPILRRGYSGPCPPYPHGVRCPSDALGHLGIGELAQELLLRGRPAWAVVAGLKMPPQVEAMGYFALGLTFFLG